MYVGDIFMVLCGILNIDHLMFKQYDKILYFRKVALSPYSIVFSFFVENRWLFSTPNLLILFNADEMCLASQSSVFVHAYIHDFLIVQICLCVFKERFGTLN